MVQVLLIGGTGLRDCVSCFAVCPVGGRDLGSAGGGLMGGLVDYGDED